jgi:hypothetical protein
VVLTFNDDAEEKDVIEGRAKFDLRKVWPARPRRRCIGCIIGVYPQKCPHPALHAESRVHAAGSTPSTRPAAQHVRSCTRAVPCVTLGGFSEDAGIFFSL